MKKLMLLVCVVFAAFIFIHGTTPESSIRSRECNKENVYLALKELDIKYVDVVYAQIMLESANLKSKLFKTNNNMIGMKHPRIRLTTSLGSKHGYAHYKDWYSCLEDYAMYQNNVIGNKHMTRSQYIAYLKKRYATDPRYKQKLLATITKDNQLIKQADSIYIAKL
jgi:flagellum-specific peptidoglycan hydrolase FlgJ